MSKLVNVGIIGCGEVAQLIHIPTLNHMSHFFRITYICDLSPKTLQHCRQKVNHFSDPKTTLDAEQLCASPDVDVVFVLSSTEIHAQHAALALRYDKIAFIEKPMALNQSDVDVLVEAERSSKGTVMVGYMRRYAPAFLDAVKEIGGMGQIRYATVRDIIGQNSLFTSQSGMFPKYFDDYSEEDKAKRKEVLDEMNREALQEDLGVKVTDESKMMWTLIGNLGCHDLSAMREALGMPQSVLGCSLDAENVFWSPQPRIEAEVDGVLFQYPGFTVHYESGIHDVPVFDAHLEFFSKTKQVKVKYDTPYIKGLPIAMTVREDATGQGSLKETTITKTYEDAYTVELRELYALATEGKPVKTTVEDAAKDLEIFQMIMRAGAEQVT